MRDIELSALNLNLLVHLHALLREANVTRAARSEGVTQSAMSHSLQKLRDLFDDPLLVRRGRETVVTPCAQGLQQPLRNALLDLQRVVRHRGRFDPAVLERSFQIACPDYRSTQERAPRVPRFIVRSEVLRSIAFIALAAVNTRGEACR